MQFTDDPAGPQAPDQRRILVNAAAWAALVRPWNGMSLSVRLQAEYVHVHLQWLQPDCVALDCQTTRATPLGPGDVAPLLHQVHATLATFPPDWQPEARGGPA